MASIKAYRAKNGIKSSQNKQGPLMVWLGGRAQCSTMMDGSDMKIFDATTHKTTKDDMFENKIGNATYDTTAASSQAGANEDVSGQATDGRPAMGSTKNNTNWAGMVQSIKKGYSGKPLI